MAGRSCSSSSDIQCLQCLQCLHPGRREASRMVMSRVACSCHWTWRSKSSNWSTHHGYINGELMLPTQKGTRRPQKADFNFRDMQPRSMEHMSLRRVPRNGSPTCPLQQAGGESACATWQHRECASVQACFALTATAVALRMSST